MRVGDRQFGRPQILYKDTKSNIEALSTGVEEGSIAYATDTNQIGSYNGAFWDWGGSGGSGYVAHLHGICRWSCSAGQSVFDYPDVVESVDSVYVNGLFQDPISYSVTYNQLVLDIALPYDSIITSNYLIRFE